MPLIQTRSWDSVATRYGLDSPKFESRQEQIFLFFKDQLWGPPRLLINGHRVSFLGVRLPGRDAYHSTVSSVQVMNGTSYTSTPPIRLHGVKGNTLPFTDK